ncbi:TPA: magnesium-translocating P-type ATPase [Candidatus Wolfebacteria bacterium]|nr:magnesium-translocating P-type ATPase [Candidatus Wolfebacteria bacterium]
MKRISSAPDHAVGLTSREVEKRLAHYGLNTIYKKKHLRPIIVFFEKFNSPLLIILITASIVSFFLGEQTKTIIILSMVVLSAVLDFINSYRSEQAVLRLTSRVANTATVLRDGTRQEINLSLIVPGDILFLSAGDVVPADAEIVTAEDFFVNQASLTGESFPIEKHTSADSADAIIFMGTSVVTGSATAVVRATGSSTEFGRIAQRLDQAAPESDFDKGIKRFSYFIMRITVLLIIAVFLIHIFLGHAMFETFLFAVAVAVGITPELLPVIISISLSRGSMIMAKKDVIVKHLPSIQNFGSMNVLCTDKTGTLTEDKIVMVNYLDSFGEVYEPILLYSYITSALHTGIKSPLDAAIAEHKKLDITAYKKIDEIPFDFERKRGSIVVEHAGEGLLITKGTPEDILSISTSCEKSQSVCAFDPTIIETATQRYEQLSADGFRVLAIATRSISLDKKRYTKDEEHDMTFLGFIVFLDPPKTTAPEAVRDLHDLGIEIKILTGDSDILTKKICSDIGLPIRGIITGKELTLMNEAELMQRVPAITIFARINPEQKERIVLALKRIGSVVGYMGDGINDAPALRAADVGISVNNAVDVAKETAGIILLRKSLRALRDGVVEGRKTFHNTQKYILMGLSSNFGNMLSMTVVSLFIPFLPMLPSQILLNNFLYDSSQGTLPSDAVDNTEICKPPKWDLPFLKRFMLVFGLMSTLFDFVTFGLLFFVFNLSERQFQTGWFIESLATQIFVIYIIRTKKVPFLQSSPGAFLVTTTAGAVAIAWIIPFTPLGRYFLFERLPLPILLSISGIVIVYLFSVEFIKRIFYKRITATT